MASCNRKPSRPESAVARKAICEKHLVEVGSKSWRETIRAVTLACQIKLRISPARFIWDVWKAAIKRAEVDLRGYYIVLSTACRIQP